jgi:hypothetical protein
MSLMRLIPVHFVLGVVFAASWTHGAAGSPGIMQQDTVCQTPPAFRASRWPVLSGKKPRNF